MNESLLPFPAISRAISDYVRRCSPALPAGAAPANRTDPALANLFRFALNHEYTDLLSKHYPLAAMFDSMRAHLRGSQELYHQFDSRFDLAAFFGKYPLLQHLAKEKITVSVAAAKEREARLLSDAALLEKIFNINAGEPLLEVTVAGDLHNGGRATTVLQFHSGKKIVYKPRSGALDAGFHQWIAQFNRSGRLPSIELPVVVDRGAYCWCAFVEPDACSSDAEVSTYYEKAGALLAFVHLNKGTDLHFENIIAQGSNPVLIDLEGLFHYADQAPFRVTDTGLLPYCYFLPDGRLVDMSGLGAQGRKEAPHKTWKWIDAGTDAVNLVRSSGYYEARYNQPRLHSNPIAPADYQLQLISGFRIAANWLREQKDCGSLIKALSACEHRVILRPTQYYYDLLNGSLMPAQLEPGHRRNWLRARLLTSGFYNPGGDEALEESIVALELEALENGDIPYFSANSHSTGLRSGSSPELPGFFSRPAIDMLQDRMKMLRDEDTEEEMSLIEASLAPIIIKQAAFSPAPESTLATRADIQLERLLTQVSQAAVLTRTGPVWRQPVQDGLAIAYQLAPRNLYLGSTGIAFFLEVAGRGKGLGAIADLAQESLAADARFFQRLSRSADASWSSGVAGLIDSLCQAGQVHHIDEALRLAHYYRFRLRDNNRLPDIIGGSAGTLQALTTLYGLTGDNEVLDGCRLIAAHLVAQSHYDLKTKTRWWTGIGGQRLTGMAHGAAGIGLALLRFWELSRDGRYLDAYLDSVRFEQQHFCTKTGNWRDLRKQSGGFAHAWCHGAAGIGSARLSAYRILQTPSLLDDARAAAAAIVAAPPAHSGSYCCGSAGRLGFLLDAAEVLQSKMLQAGADRVLNELFGQYERYTNFNTIPGTTLPLDNLSLFKGLSGIGLVLYKYRHDRNLRLPGT
ncbi:type 2 lanthipeptide synthetase LanM [Flaviaesturariibacter flavus]|nr:type 2 lanthipeptide synthetase LanM [Flaviaesturariibacter flavus]